MARRNTHDNKISISSSESAEPELTSAAQDSRTKILPTDSADPAHSADAYDHAPAQSDVMTTARSRPKPSSKLGIVLGLLEARDGATLDRLIAVTGWLPHTTRAALTGLRKRGHAVTSGEQLQPDGRNLNVYRIGDQAAD
ncbi:DUF3489 domain-containing protein [Bosea sp. (in: a-proteobacteria)]|uniref:DUF3489 domain-containing protein n=1 Tax=Bosea sp. (in: a-proteobacteria) TaxID=1871050 RepID=UPI0031FEC972